MISIIKFKIIYKVRDTINLFSKKPKIKNTIETIEYLNHNKVSIVRFGDGEFDLILNNRSLVFQKEDNLLEVRLKEILKSNEKNILVCIPNTLISIKEKNEKASYFWSLYFNRNYQKLIPLLNFNHYYGDSLFTRLYIDYINKEESKKLFQKLFELWRGEDIVVVEGNMSNLGIGNDLFKEVNSIIRISCPSTNAFEKYEKILEEVIIKSTKENLILISLGPTATVLAYDLAKKGYWAVDIGHIDIEYEWMKAGVNDKVKLSNKKVWE